MRITLKQLTVFDAVARLGSISKAAEEIALSQSATSMSLQDLERNLGVPLFHRHKKKLTLNENGRRLQPQAKSVILEVRDMERVPSTEHLQGNLQVGASTTLAQYLIPRICRDFLRLNPNVNITLIGGTVGDVLSGVDSLALDVGLIEAPINRSSLSALRLGSTTIKIFASPENRLARKRAVSVEDLKDQIWFLPKVGSLTREALTLGIGERLGPMNIALESNLTEVLKQAVKGSMALSCLPLLALEEDFAAGTLAEVNVTDLNLTRPFNVVFRKDVYHGNVQKAFVDYLMSTVAPVLKEQKRR